MGVRRDHHLDAAFPAHAEIDVFQVEAVRIGIALHGDAVRGAGIQHFFHIVFDGIAAEQ